MTEWVLEREQRTERGKGRGAVVGVSEGKRIVGVDREELGEKSAVQEVGVGIVVVEGKGIVDVVG